MIAGQTVRCDSPERAVRWHSGYPMRDVDSHDGTLLCAEFELDLPSGYR